MPERTCIGCHEKAEKRELVRIVRSPEGTVSIDAGGRAAGRGAYVHRRRECLDSAMARGQVASRLKVPLTSSDRQRISREFDELCAPVGEEG